MCFVCLVITVLWGIPCVAQPAVSLPNESETHRVGLVDIGYEALLFRIHLIRNAQKTIDVQTFIWENDACGKAFMQACIDAAERGVQVRFLMDHYYSERDMDAAVALAQVHPKLQIRRYRPPNNRLNSKIHQNMAHMALAFRSHNQRMHNKVMIVDGRIALPGGRNISNHYFDYIADRNYLDRDVLITGPLVEELKASFEEYWDYHRSVPLPALRDVKKALAKPNAPTWAATYPSDYDTFLQTLYRDLEHSDRIEQTIQARMQPVDHAWVSVDPPGKKSGFGLWNLGGGSRSAVDLMKVMETAEQSILIQSPYMVMSTRSGYFFRHLHREHPDLHVELLTNSYASTGNMAAYAGAFRTRPAALRYGIDVYEFKPEPRDLALFMPPVADGQPDLIFDKLSVHAKSLVVDQQTAYVGSFNLDPRSMHLNTELGIVVEDIAFAQRLEYSIRLSLDSGNCWRVEYRTMPFGAVNRKIEWTSQHLPLDLWPITSTELIEGETSIGTLPTHDRWSRKRWMFRINKTLGLITRPLI